MKYVFVFIKDLKEGRSFKLPAFDSAGRSIVSKPTYQVVGKLLTKYKCIDIYTGEIVYLPCNSYVKIVV